jgi:4-amino-4-deoxy-L-arabinose transferase-like glycosyltransferase
MDERGTRSGLRDAALLVALCLPLFFVGLGRYELDTKAEPREGVTAWEMLHSGRWALPLLNGEFVPEKPLVFPWLVAVSTVLFGEGSELAARVPAALSAVAVVLIVRRTGARLLGPRGGLVAGAMIATTALVVNLGRRARVDMTLTAFFCIALDVFLEVWLRARDKEGERLTPGGFVLFWGAIVLGTLTKGPLGAILPGLVIVPFVLVQKNVRFLWALWPVPGVIFYVLGAGWWYVNGLLDPLGKEFAHTSFMMENIEMFLGAKTGGGHQHGFFYLFQYLPAHGAPWILYLPATIALAARRHAWRDERFLLPALHLGVLFLFFSIASGKRGDYLLPLMPGSALLAAWLFEEAERDGLQDRSLRRDLLLSGAPQALAAVVALVALPIALTVDPEQLMARLLPRPEDARMAARAVVEVRAQPLVIVLGVAAILGLGITPLLATWRRRPLAAVLANVAGVLAAVLIVVFGAMPAARTGESRREFAREVSRIVPADVTVGQFDAFEFQVLFYSCRRLPTLDVPTWEKTVREPGRWVITKRRHFDELPADVRATLATDAANHRPSEDPAEDFLLLRVLDKKS